MARMYDARGNIYIVVAPEALRQQGIAVPDQAGHAAQNPRGLGVGGHCGVLWLGPGYATTCSKDHCSDGLLVGPFQSSPPFDLLIVNTDWHTGRAQWQRADDFLPGAQRPGVFTQR